MTENMAGRGEGLAGLVAKIEALPKVYLHSVTDEKRYVNRDRVLTILRAALEAAAPAGTAQTEYLIKRARVWSEADLRSFPTATLELIDALAAALATPSPQAPAGDRAFSTTSAREQSSATASDSLDVAAQIILKQHWPVIHNMEENEARQREVKRIIEIIEQCTWQAAKEESDKWYEACRNPRADDPRAYCISKAVRK